MNGHYASLSRAQYDVRVHGNKVAIAKHILNGELLVWKLDMILDHGLLQRRKTCRKEWIVVLTTKIHILSISLINLACHDEMQELNSYLFASLNVVDICNIDLSLQIYYSVLSP